MWSIGCIFAELLTMQKKYVSNHTRRKPIFPGKSCFPLTSDKSDKYNDVRKRDQLNVIFDVIGTPSREECDLFSTVKNYLIRLEPKEKKPFSKICMLFFFLIFNFFFFFFF
eukprot:GSMAST32.ASY1.ANO1.1270.1 assembled CDS